MPYKKKEKKSLLLYYDYIEQFELLDDKQLRKLIYAMIDFDKNEKETKLDRMTNMAFVPIKRKLVEDKKAWLETCKVNSENAKKRWDKEYATAYDGMRKDAKYADIDKDKDIDKEKEKDIECVNITPLAPISLPDLIEYGEKIGVNVEYCEKFYDTYESTGWINKNGQKITNAKSLLKKWAYEDKKKDNKKEETEDLIDEAGFVHKNGRRVF